jgi:hypothetical protein
MHWRFLGGSPVVSVSNIMIFIFAMGIVVAIVVGLLLLFVAGCCCHCWLVKSIFRKIQTMAPQVQHSK